MEIAPAGDPNTAETAYRYRLVNRVTEPGEALDGALRLAARLAARIAANGPLAVAATKRVVAASIGWSDAEGFAHRRETVGHVFGSADALEGARAFAEKRPPVWRGE